MHSKITVISPSGQILMNLKSCPDFSEDCKLSLFSS